LNENRTLRTTAQVRIKIGAKVSLPSASRNVPFLWLIKKN